MRFTVRRPPSGEVSPCGHRPSGGDVACSVHVGVAPSSSAGLALEDRLALAVSGCDVPACGATLRRVRGRDLLDAAESLVLQTCDELAPATSADRAVERALLGHSRPRLQGCAACGAGHRPHVKSLDPDQVELPRDLSGGLLDPILAPVSLAGLQLRDRLLGLLAAVRPPVTAGQPPLQHSQPLRLTRTQTRRMQKLACGQRRRHGNAAVDADHAAIAGARDRFGDVGERDMPAPRSITRDPVGLDTGWHGARPAEPHPPDLGHPYLTEVPVQSLDVMRFDRDLPEPFVHTGFAPRWAAMRTVEEVPHGLGEIAQRLLLYRLTPGSKPRLLGARLGQLRALLAIAGGLAPRLPVLLLLHRQIPYVPRVAAMRQQGQQGLLLLRGRQQSKPETYPHRNRHHRHPQPRRAHPRDRLRPRNDVKGFQPKEA